jgi:hypothetical protein
METADTIYALADEPPRSCGVDRDDRTRLQAGAIGRGSLREICFLRRITPLGAVLCMETKPTVGEQLDLELLTGDRLRGEVEWVEGSDVGLRFNEVADMFALITRNLVHQPGDLRRMPRIELECPAWLEAGSRREIVNVKNLSDGGARIQTRAPLVPHEQITLTLDGFRPVSGIVRWVQGTVAGIAFAPELPWHELMPWLRRRYRPRVQAPAKAKVTPPVELTTAPPTQERGEIALNLPARVREGSRRWSIEVASVDTRQIRFISYGSVDSGRLFWITLPGLEGWPARVVEVDGYHVTCVFTQPLHPAVLERVLAAGNA